jgi:serine/threonine protein kinase
VTTLPQHIGPYRPLHRIGAGGMGTVYFAYHPASGAPIAVKVLHPDFASDASYRARFVREVAVLRKVSGPYLIPLTDADTQADVPWLAMPYVPGNTLHGHIMAHGPLRDANVLTFSAAVAHALSCIHAVGVAHRDLKPANVILADDGPRVVDFGIAHHLDATAVTTTSVRTGTPGWMAPEQFTRGVTTPACDVFAWGLLIAYAAAGTHPFGTPTGIDHRIVHATPDLSAVPARLLPLVTAALDKDPERRPSAVRLAEQAAALHGPNGTAVFPTVEYTQLAYSVAEAPTAGLDTSQWDIPAADTDLTRAGSRSEEQSSAPGEQAQHAAHRLPSTAHGRAIPSLPFGVPQPPASGSSRGEPSAESFAWPPPPQIPPADLPGQNTPTWRRRPSGPRPAARRWRTRAASSGLVTALVVGVAIAGSLAYANRSHRNTAAQVPAASPSVTHTVSRPVAAASTSAPTTASPSLTPAATSSPTPSPLKLFGGLRLTLPGAWQQTEVPHEALRFHDGMDSEYGTEFSPLDDATRGGLALEWASGLTAIDGSIDGVSPNLGAFSSRFSIGAAAPSGSDGTANVPDQTVTSASSSQQTTFAGRPAQRWTVHTDVLLDYNHTRTAVHRVWYLPYSHYVLYTYGTLTGAQDNQVDDILASARVTAADMPLDCADAIAYIDAAATGKQSAGDDPSQSCLDIATGLTTDAPLDPGTVQTKTTPECLALIGQFDNPVTVSGDITGYTSARRRCDLPRES